MCRHFFTLGKKELQSCNRGKCVSTQVGNRSCASPHLALGREKRAGNKSAVENVFHCFLLETEIGFIFFPMHVTVKEWLNELIVRLITLYLQIVSPRSELNQQ